MHACTSEQVNTCNHMQTQACAMGWAHLTKKKNDAQAATHAGRQTCCSHAHTHTHKRSHPKSSSVMRSHSTLDKPLCEPDKAGEGTQQPLNTGVGCIRQLTVPADAAHIADCGLYLV